MIPLWLHSLAVQKSESSHMLGSTRSMYVQCVTNSCRDETVWSVTWGYTVQKDHFSAQCVINDFGGDHHLKFTWEFTVENVRSHVLSVRDVLQEKVLWKIMQERIQRKDLMCVPFVVNVLHQVVHSILTSNHITKKSAISVLFVRSIFLLHLQDRSIWTFMKVSTAALYVADVVEANMH